MRDRPRPFDCPIAGKTVGIVLRHGGGLQEPAKVYVRCDERDCQYVDLNEPPCPLRIEMFSDGSDRRVAEYLSRHAGRRFCYACLTETLGVSYDQIRRASWRLIEDGGFYVRPARCVECRRRRITIGLSSKPDSRAGAFTVEAHGVIPDERFGALQSSKRVVDFLHERNQQAFCATCVAFACDVALADAKRILTHLEASPEFERIAAVCAACGREQMVFRSVTGSRRGP